MKRENMYHHKAGRTGCLVAVLAAAAMLTCAVGGLIKVGGKAGWKENVNYTQWAAHRHFYVGDWLYFVFDKRYYNALEVNKANYEQCRDAEFIRNITRGGRDVFNLTEERPYYFLSSGGYCFHGMKLSIRVEESPPPPPPPAPPLSSAKNGASPGTKANQIIFSWFMLVMAWEISAFVFKIFVILIP